MSKYLRYFVIAALLTGCGVSEDRDPVEGPGDGQGGDADVPACEQMTCAHGCCDGVCVDLRTDPEHCGRCGTKCGDAFCADGVCRQECTGENMRLCEGRCVNIATNGEHCGDCNRVCGPQMACTDGKCGCLGEWADCDGNAENGCEVYAMECICTSGKIQQCYTYPSGTPGVGRCRYGTTTCKDGYWSSCDGDVGPAPEILDNGIDDDCNGLVDESNVDADGDGYTRGDGDCCDSFDTCEVKIDCPPGKECWVTDPALVHPGAWDDPGNGIDDNCDGIIDDGSGTGGGSVSESCSESAHDFPAGSRLGSDAAVLLARAMDICGTATETSGSGLIRAELLLADGSPLPGSGNASICGSTTKISPAEQVAVMTDLGGVVKPVANATMAVLSSGRAEGSSNKGSRDCVGTEVKAPKIFLDAHDGVLPSSAVCGNSRRDTKANDSVMLRLKLRAPDTAHGFSFKFKFFSKEYPSFVCDNYNDFFLALVDGRSADIPADHNVAFDENRDPVSVNNAFFTECDKSACTKPRGCSSCKNGSSNLKGYVSDVSRAGATGWLMTSVPVTGGEVFTLDLIIFDAGERENGRTTSGYGHLYDSLVLLDGFVWQSRSTSLGTTEIVN